MTLRKRMIALAIAAAPVSASFAEVKSLEDFQKSCQALKDRGQVSDLNLEVKCNASITHWVSTKAPTSLATSHILQASARSKGGQWGTAPMSFSMNSEAQAGSCHNLVQYSVSMPKPISVKLTSCDDLTPQKIHQLCESKAIAYCRDNMDSSSSSESSSKDPMAACKSVEVARSTNCGDYL